MGQTEPPSGIPPQPGVSLHGKPSCVTWVPRRPGLSASSQCLPLTDAAPALARQTLSWASESLGSQRAGAGRGCGHGVPDGQGLLDLEGQMHVSEHLCRTRLPAEALGCSLGGGVDPGLLVGIPGCRGGLVVGQGYLCHLHPPLLPGLWVLLPCAAGWAPGFGDLRSSASRTWTEKH